LKMITIWNHLMSLSQMIFLNHVVSFLPRHLMIQIYLLKHHIIQKSTIINCLSYMQIW
jgi:hypothetical protein